MNRSINVDVQTSYVQEQSDPTEDRYVFAYTVTIRNDSDKPALQLLLSTATTLAVVSPQQAVGHPASALYVTSSLTRNLFFPPLIGGTLETTIEGSQRQTVVFTSTKNEDG